MATTGPEGEEYDSRPDTYAHIVRVQELLAPVAAELVRRGIEHDRSKLHPPERDTFDAYTPKLKASTYGSDEYKDFLAGMAGSLRHHYAENRHHPEHFQDGIDGMTLIDLMEMLADWKAATERHEDGDMARSMAIQQERFGISDQLLRILGNTVDALGWW